MLIGIGIFFSLFSCASASEYIYTQNVGTALTNIAVDSSGNNTATLFSSTSTIPANAITVNLCKENSVGAFWAEIYESPYASSTLPGFTTVYASSTQYNPSSLPSCSGSPNTNATATIIRFPSTFILNTGITYFIKVLANGGASLKQTVTAAGPSGNLVSYTISGGTSVTPSSGTWSIIKISSDTYGPTAWQLYTSTTTIASPECGFTNIGGCIGQAVAWAFFPDQNILDSFKAINFASSSPFGYLYDMDDAYQAFMTGLNATSTSFKIVLDMTTLGSHADVFNKVSTSSVTVFDICWVNKEMGELPANAFRDKFLPNIVFMMWIGLGWLFYSVAHKIW